MALSIAQKDGLTGRVRRIAGPWAERLTDLIYPPQCVACFGWLGEGRSPQVCADCRAAMFDDDGVPCARCGARADSNPFATHCRQCHGQRFAFRRAVALGNYHGRLRECVYQFKRRGQEPLAFQVGRLLGEYWGLNGGVPSEVDCVAPLPSHRWRQWQRGMNPAGVVAEGFAQSTGCFLIPDLLRYRRWTSKQGMLSRPQRLLNVRRSMRVDRTFDVTGARVVLIDDVMASGATVNEAAKTLRAAGAACIEVALVARGVGTF